MSNINIQEHLEIAKNVAKLAGKFLLKSNTDLRKVNKDLEHDIKIQADIESEKIILDYIKQKSNFSILSEECGEVNTSENEYTWIVDPVDGSLNYSQQIPLCCVSIGLWSGENPILGVVYDFNRDEMYSGISNETAWLNDQCISVSGKKMKSQSVLSTGFPGKTELSDENMEVFTSFVREFQKVRLFGSAALSIVYVASGKVDAYYEKNIMFWDVAGAIPIVLGAGGVAIFNKTSQQNSLNVQITNNKIIF